MTDYHNHYKLRRYYLSLSTFGGIVPWASHWWCRIYWEDDAGKDHEANAEHGRGVSRTGSFDTIAAARSAGLRLIRKLADKDWPDATYRIVTRGNPAVIDPQETLSAPGNLKPRLNKLWREFEKLNGWEAPKEKWPEVQKVCDNWSALLGERWEKPSK